MNFWNVPNTVSVIRTAIIPIAIVFLFLGGNLALLGTSLIILSFLLDGIDGWLAKKLNQKTVLGSLIDVLADRITEYLLWISFAGVGIIPLWAPLIVIPRGVLTDTIRTKAVSKGISVYDLPKSNISRALISNRVPRILIGLGKMILFSLASLVMSGMEISRDCIFWLTVFVVIINLARGLPVILEGWRILED